MEAHNIIDRTVYRMGAISLALGVIALDLLNFIHPHEQNPNDFPAVFAEYAASTHWVMLHMGQMIAGLLVLILGMMAIHRSLIAASGASDGLARAAFGMAVASAAVFIVDQAVDGIALKKMVDGLAIASAPEVALDFRIAQAVRWVVVGLDTGFGFSEGGTIVLFGLAMLTSSHYPKWVGWLGIVNGLAEIAAATATVLTGFSTLVTGLNWFTFGANSLWVIAVVIVLWRHSRA